MNTHSKFDTPSPPPPPLPGVPTIHLAVVPPAPAIRASSSSASDAAVGSTTNLSKEAKTKMMKKEGGKKKGSSRGTRITPTERVIITQAYFKASESSEHGANKKGDKFWDDVHFEYDKCAKIWELAQQDKMRKLTASCSDDFVGNIVTTLPRRTRASIKSHFLDTVQPALNKFTGIRAVNPPETGEDPVRYHERLMLTYMDQNEGKDFHPFYDAWIVAEKHPRFANDAISSSASPTDLLEKKKPAVSRVRPMGRDAAKAAKQADVKKKVMEELGHQGFSAPDRSSSSDALDKILGKVDGLTNVLERFLTAITPDIAEASSSPPPAAAATTTTSTEELSFLDSSSTASSSTEEALLGTKRAASAAGLDASSDEDSEDESVSSGGDPRDRTEIMKRRSSRRAVKKQPYSPSSK